MLKEQGIANCYLLDALSGKVSISRESRERIWEVDHLYEEKTFVR